MRIFAIILLFLSFNALAGERLPSLLSSGSWKLSKTSMGKASVLSIEEYIAIFNKDGTWTYSAKMIGNFKGMEMSGSGEWKVNGNNLEYTVGDKQGKSKIEITDSVLTLSPDPVLFYNGSEAIETYYKNVPQ